MPRVRRGGAAELVGLYVLGNGKAAQTLLGKVLRVFGVQLKNPTADCRRIFLEVDYGYFVRGAMSSS